MSMLQADTRPALVREPEASLISDAEPHFQRTCNHAARRSGWTDASHKLVSLLGTVALVLCLTEFSSCPPNPPPPPPTVAFTQQATDISRGGRAVAVTINSGNSQLAIAAGESGGLFRTTDGGNTWTHIDTLAPFRLNDVAFAEPGASNSQVVITTASKDAHIALADNVGGIWQSTDAGATWSHIALPACSAPQNAYGIAYSGANRVYIATDCGLLRSEDLGSHWTVTLTVPARAVIVRQIGATNFLDVCTQDGGLVRSTDGGASWGARRGGLACETSHAIAGSPLDGAVLFATTAPGLKQSLDGGATWTDLQATAYNERPVWVRTHRAADQDPTHFDVYYPGRRVVCSTSCSSNAGESWPRVPNSSFNHDINGIAFDPTGNCPLLMVSDYGVFKAPPAQPAPCGDPANWTHVGRVSTGFNALQIYQVTGQMQSAVPGVSTTGVTSLFLGTMDNTLWAVPGAGSSGWVSFGAPEGSFIQVQPEVLLGTPPPALLLTFMDFGSRGVARKVTPFWANWSTVTPPTWTAAQPPGNGTAPTLIKAGTYTQWSSDELFLTSDSGVTWSKLVVLPQVMGNAVQTLKFGATAVTKTPAGPALYEYVSNGSGSGLALLAHMDPTPTPRVLEVQTLAGTNNRGFNSGLGGIYGNCFGPGAWYCQPVFAVDPNDYRNLIAADPKQLVMAMSNDAGESWTQMQQLTGLVTAGGTLSFTDALGSCQAHVIAYDPRNSLRVLVGTDQAGIIASANGGQTWSALPGTSQAPAISSIYFDDLSSVVWVASYGRGLWRLTIDWSTVK